MSLRIVGATIAVLAGGIAGCFTADGLRDQPCRSDADCNAIIPAFGQHITCQDGVCGVVCGDGVVAEGFEDCDDGNDVDSDECVACKNAVCGDGAVRTGFEDCDDGNDDRTDACVDCKLAVCGDGSTWLGQEECDDSPANGCAGCTLAVCGDGAVNPLTEACDDGNAEENDGCTSACVRGAERLFAGLADHTCALAVGALRCWGASQYGQLGYGTRAPLGDEPEDLPPADVPASAAIRAVAVGEVHTCVLLDSDGDNIRCWGSNEYGSLGTPGAGDPHVGDEPGELPTIAVDVGGKAVQIAAADRHTCAVLEGGAVRCWGDSQYSGFNLGFGFYPGLVGDDESPSAFPPLQLGGPAVAVSMGVEHTCALLAGGVVRCWGAGYGGALGVPALVGDIGDDEVPAAYGPVELGGPAIQIGAGSFHTCALLADGTVRCWGTNYGGTLGYPGVDAIGDDEHPAAHAPVRLGGEAVQIGVGPGHTCALLADGGVRCWGTNGAGQLGLGHVEDIGDDEHPEEAPPVDLGGPALEVVVGNYFGCARQEGGVVRCWGDNAGKLGVGHSRAIGDEPGELPPEPVILYATP